jgi:hypothetical protein
MSVRIMLTTPPYNTKYGGIITAKGRCAMPTSSCKECGREIKRAGSKAGTFCSLICKGAWQRTQKPATREWLYQKYVIEGWSTYRIGREVARDPKRVFEWLTGYGIPLRSRRWDVTAGSSVLDDAAWLQREYVEKQRSTGEIAREAGMTEANVIFFLRKHGIKRRSISEARAVKHWGSDGEKNPMFGKRGAETPSWKGGVTPDRQAFYSSPEWIEAAKAVWKRDNGECQRCRVKANDVPRGYFHIHHIVSFAVKALRAEQSNLVLLCTACHRWAHSKKNVDRLFLAESAERGGEG